MEVLDTLMSASACSRALTIASLLASCSALRAKVSVLFWASVELPIIFSPERLNRLHLTF